jgi:hypothetical protein
MGIVDSMLSAGSGGIANQLAGQFGINSDQAASTISALVPALAGGIKQKIESGDTGLTSLLTSGKLTVCGRPLDPYDSGRS